MDTGAKCLHPQLNEELMLVLAISVVSCTHYGAARQYGFTVLHDVSTFCRALYTLYVYIAFFATVYTVAPSKET